MGNKVRDFECMKSVFIFSSESFISFQYVLNHFHFNSCERRLFLKSMVLFLILSLCCHLGSQFVADYASNIWCRFSELFENRTRIFDFIVLFLSSENALWVCLDITCKELSFRGKAALTQNSQKEF